MVGEKKFCRVSRLAGLLAGWPASCLDGMGAQFSTTHLVGLNFFVLNCSFWWRFCFVCIFFALMCIPDFSTTFFFTALSVAIVAVIDLCLCLVPLLAVDAGFATVLWASPKPEARR